MSINDVHDKHKEKIIICPVCKGAGKYGKNFAYTRETGKGVEFHSVGDTCETCDGVGRVKKETQVTYHQLKEA